MRYDKRLIEAVMKQKNVSFKTAVSILRAIDYEKSVMRDLRRMNRQRWYRRYD